MNKYKLIAAFIVALTLMAALGVGIGTTLCLNLLPSPWNHIANGLFCLAMLTLGVYLYFSKLEKKDNDEN